MYLQYFNFKLEPFALVPDSDFLFLSRTHKKALLYLNYALWNHNNFTLISGDVGTGKTILLQHVLKTVPEDSIVITINQTQISPIELLEVVANKIGFINAKKNNKASLYKLINGFFSHYKDRTIVFIIDEAQRLPIETLEELRLLVSNDLNKKDSNINVILCGQPELREIIESPKLEQLDQRIRLKFDLKRLNRIETIEYIRYRLTRAGQTLDLFSNESLARIYQYTNGLPRKINLIADTALTCAFADGITSITTTQVDDAASELQWEKPDDETSLNNCTTLLGTDKIIRLKPIKKLLTEVERGKFEGLKAIEIQLSRIADSLETLSSTKEINIKSK